ncbi:MAG: triphosphoribosyl-dephospho-CoA synthase [Betaproteobacteria bacterium]
MNSSRLSDLEKWSAALVCGAKKELYLTPKPGLVDLANCGSHPDLSVSIMEESIGYVSDYLQAVVLSLANNEPFECQKNLGIEAEKVLFDALATNTHKGYVFLSGMLLIARWHAPASDENALRTTLSKLAEGFFRAAQSGSTHGQKAREKYHAGGIVQEAIKGFPALFEHALPAFRSALREHSSIEVASFAMLARLMQCVDDTTTLHRGGTLALSRLKRDGHELEMRIANGDDYLSYLDDLNRDYVRMNLTMGGVADMLGLAFAVLLASGEIPGESEGGWGLKAY